jgi:hypothetical protein
MKNKFSVVRLFSTINTTKQSPKTKNKNKNEKWWGIGVVLQGKLGEEGTEREG